MDCDLVGSVTRTTGIVLVPVVILAGVLGGWEGAAGALAGGIVSLVSFRWIARGSRRAALGFAAGRPGTMWVLGLGLRHAIFFGAIALCLWSGLAHPLGIVAGMSLLPPVLVLFGLRTAARVA